MSESGVDLGGIALPPLPVPANEHAPWATEEVFAVLTDYARRAVLLERSRCVAMREEGYRAGLEEAARIVDGVCPAAWQLDLRKALAAAIRAEKEKPPAAG